MTTSFKLNLPTDNPWKRKYVSPDVMDQHICDEVSRYRWRSSIAVFECEPEEENQTYEGMRISYYPCYGAVLEVAVGPEDETHTPLDDYPYFLGFNPKKLYKLVTNTGETMPRSLENVELGKSDTSTSFHEVVDIDKGWSAAGEVKAGTLEQASIRVGRARRHAGKGPSSLILLGAGLLALGPFIGVMPVRCHSYRPGLSFSCDQAFSTMEV